MNYASAKDYNGFSTNANSGDIQGIELQYYQKFYEKWMLENAYKLSVAATPIIRFDKNPKINTKFEAKREALFEGRRLAKIRPLKIRKRKNHNEI